MNIKINGNITEIGKEVSLKDLAQQFELNIDKIVIEYNGDIPNKEDFESIFVKEDDQIEFIHFVGGG